MSNNSNARSSPAPDAGSNHSSPDLSVVPPPLAKRSPSDLNQAQVREVQRIILVCLAAQKPAYASALEAKGITAAFVVALLASARGLVGTECEVLDHESNSEVATHGGMLAKKTLITSLRGLQSAGRQLHLHTSPEKLKDYLVGNNITSSRAILDTSAQVIVGKANAERPPGVDTTLILRVQGEIATFTGANEAQGDEQVEAQDLRGERNTTVKSVKAGGQIILIAADRAWPSSDRQNAGVRRKFHLPAHRTYAPRTK